MGIEDTFDGSDFRYIDSDAYAEDAPEDVALDAATYNEAAAIQRRGRQASWAEKQIEDDDEPVYYSCNPFYFFYTPVYISEGAVRLEVVLDYEIRPNTAEDKAINVGVSVVFVSDNQTYDNWMTLGADGREREIIPVVLRRFRKSGWAIVGVYSENYGNVPNNDEVTGVTVSGSPSAMVFNSGDPTTNEGWDIDRDVAISPSGFQSGRSAQQSVSDIIRWAPNGYDNTSDSNNFSVAPPSLNMVGGTRSDYDVFRVYGIRPYSVQVRQPINTGSTSASNVEAGKLPEYQKGAGQQVRVGRQVIDQPRTDVLDFEQRTRPDVEAWDRHPRWHYVSGSDSPPQLKVETSIFCEVESPRFEVRPLMAGVMNPAGPTGAVASSIPQLSTKAQSKNVDITVSLYTFGGTLRESSLETHQVTVWPTLITGEYPFLLQQLISFKEPEFNVSPGYTFREGQLSLPSTSQSNTSQRGPVSDLDLLAPVNQSIRPTGLRDQDPFRLVVTFDVSNFDDNHRLVVFGGSVTQHVVF